MSIGHDIEEAITTLPHDWASARFSVRLERLPSMNAGPSELRAAAVAGLASYGGRADESGVEFTVTPATWRGAAREARAVEHSGVRGQVELVEVSGPDISAASRWRNRPETFNRSAIEPVGAGYRLRSRVA